MIEHIVQIPYNYDIVGIAKSDRTVKRLNIFDANIDIKCIELDDKTDDFPLAAELSFKSNNSFLDKYDYRTYNNQLMRPMFAEIRKDRKTTTTISLQDLLESRVLPMKPYNEIFNSSDKKLYKLYCKSIKINDYCYLDIKYTNEKDIKKLTSSITDIDDGLQRYFENFNFVNKEYYVNEIKKNLGTLVSYKGQIFIKTNPPIIFNKSFSFDIGKKEFLLSSSNNEVYFSSVAEKLFSYTENKDYYIREIKNSIFTINQLEIILDENRNLKIDSLKTPDFLKEVKIFNHEVFNLKFNNNLSNIETSLIDLNRNREYNIIIFLSLIEPNFYSHILDLKSYEVKINDMTDSDVFNAFKSTVKNFSDTIKTIKKFLKNDEYYSNKENSLKLKEKFLYTNEEDFESESFLKIINKEIDKLESSLLRTEKMLNIYQTVEEKKHLLVNDYKF